jgi:hypothetical protein
MQDSRRVEQWSTSAFRVGTSAWALHLVVSSLNHSIYFKCIMRVHTPTCKLQHAVGNEQKHPLCKQRHAGVSRSLCSGCTWASVEVQCAAAAAAAAAADAMLTIDASVSHPPLQSSHARPALHSTSSQPPTTRHAFNKLCLHNEPRYLAALTSPRRLASAPQRVKWATALADMAQWWLTHQTAMCCCCHYCHG